MAQPQPGTQAWLDQVQESIIDPDREIVDPHHHLWHFNFGSRYLLDDLWRDTDAGHRVTKTVYVECRSFYRDDGPAHLRSVGETEMVAKVAAESAADPARATISGIVARADLQDTATLDEALAAHEDAGRGLFKGIRHTGAHAREPEGMLLQTRAPDGLYADPSFRQGVARLGELGLTYDTWHFHYQNTDYLELARAVPGTTMILDHFGVPLGVGAYADKRDEVFEQWRKDISAIAECPNVVAKLGGLAMPDNGFGWHEETATARLEDLCRSATTLLPAHHRGVWSRALHVREQLSGGSAVDLIPRTMERAKTNRCRI